MVVLFSFGHALECEEASLSQRLPSHVSYPQWRVYLTLEITCVSDGARTFHFGTPLHDFSALV